MIKRKNSKRHKLSYEILFLVALTFCISLVVFTFLFSCGISIAENFCEARQIALTTDYYHLLEDGIYYLSFICSVVFFLTLFLFLLGDRLSYIREITSGIDLLRNGRFNHELPLKGNNELTSLAEAINILSAEERAVKEKELALREEKEELIRALSHDIRTPLTSVMSYSDLLIAMDDGSSPERKEYLELIRKKSEHIKELTAILLDGGNRSAESFENAKLLMEQLAEEFTESLEDRFSVFADLNDCPSFSGVFDVRELRRVFDNMISNVKKYADPTKPVFLFIGMEGDALVIRQENTACPKDPDAESYELGIRSIRRIAGNYGGKVEVSVNGDVFLLTVTLSQF